MRDVIIIGGGPAGSVAGTLLAREGVDVLLVERAAFPRDKACGEFLTPEAVRILQDLGVWPTVLAAGAVPVSRVDIHAPNGAVATYTPHSGEPAGWSIRRTALDAALLSHAHQAGVEVREQTAVRGLVTDGRLVTGVTFSTLNCQLSTLNCRLTIAADGSHSLVARRLGLVRPIRRLQRVGVVAHVRGAPPNALEMRCRQATACGYGPLADGANLTLVVPTGDAARMAGRPVDFVEERLEELFPRLVGRVLGNIDTVRTVGCFAHVCRRASAGGALLVGDAASFVDPFTGEGIYFALRGAELAAEAASRALRTGDVSAAALSAYDRSRAELRRRYLLSGIIQGVVRAPLLMNRAVSSLAASPALRARLMETIADRRPPAEALNLPFLRDLLLGAA